MSSKFLTTTNDKTDLVSRVNQAIDNSDVFDKYISSKHLLTNAKETSTGVRVSCPFHPDETPSMGINLFTKRYNCFSCGRHGGLVNLYKDYYYFEYGSYIGNDVAVNQILTMYPELKQLSGVNKITASKELKTIDFTNFVLNRNIEENMASVNYVYLAKKLKKQSPSINQIEYFISLIQNDIDAEEIQGILDSKPVKKMSLFDIAGSDEND